VTIHVETISFDAGDPQAMGRWWGEALGWEVSEADPGEVVVTPPSGSGQTELLFIAVPEGKSVKNRVHLDLRPDDQAAEVARFEALGATRVEVGQSDDPDTTWVVLADPEGNEFCILRATPVGD
jgi:predicted enzyme related to lactoylglutathione lyase